MHSLFYCESGFLLHDHIKIVVYYFIVNTDKEYAQIGHTCYLWYNILGKGKVKLYMIMAYTYIFSS